MEEMDGVAGAFVNNAITLLMTEDKPLDEAAIKKTLKDFKMNVTAVEKAEEMPF